jgi:hypothetical protein
MKNPDISQARAMLAAFESVGVRAFDITFTNIKEDANGKQELRGYRKNQSLATVRTSMPYLINNAPKYQNNVIIRPHDPPGVQLVQLDDLDSAKVERIAAHAFMTIRTSAGKDGNGNFQSWVAIADAPTEKTAAEDLARRLRKGAGADLTASGATRVSGSLNFKNKYAPDFPLIELRQVEAGRTTTPPALAGAGVVAPKEETLPTKGPFRAAPIGRPSRKKWPSYKFCVDNAPLAHGEDKPDTSRADFTWCRTAIEWGWSTQATAARLMELSDKAKRNGERYAVETATNAAASVDRQPYRLKSFSGPRS